MAWEKTSTTSRVGFERILGTPSGYTMMHGGTFSAFFKPFTTQYTASGLPHYTSGITQWGYLDSNWLNPYGSHTRGEGLICGTGLPGDLATATDYTNTRTFGHKAPMNMVGFGYDPWGFPAPNASSGYRNSGVGGGTTPSLYFKGSGVGGTGIVSYGADVPYPFWLAGPVDMCWDNERGVWFADNGIYPAKVTRTTIAGGGNVNAGQLPENVTYLCTTINVSRVIYVSGFPIDRRFPAGWYIYPLNSGSYCEIVADISGGKPRYAIVAREQLAVSGC